MTRRYVPKRGDIAWVNLDPQLGHEQRGRRPVLVLSNRSYNEKTGLAIVCPMTTKIKGYPFEVPVHAAKREGAILADHVKNIDWIARRAQYISAVAPGVLSRVASIVSALVSTDEA